MHITSKIDNIIAGTITNYRYVGDVSVAEHYRRAGSRERQRGLRGPARARVHANANARARCRCQNRRISGRGSRTIHLRLMVTGGRGHDVLPRFGPS